jgi:hypothetical protein
LFAVKYLLWTVWNPANWKTILNKSITFLLFCLTGQFAQKNKAALEAAYDTALQTAEYKKRHTTGEDLIRMCSVETTRLFFRSNM